MVVGGDMIVLIMKMEECGAMEGDCLDIIDEIQ